MKQKKTLMTLAAALIVAFQGPAKVKEYISANNVDTYLTENYLIVTADLVLDSLRLKANQQVLIIPVLQVADTTSSIQGNPTARQPKDSLLLPSVLVSGRNMHISYERGSLRGFPALKDHEIWKELKRNNGTAQTVEYVAKLPLEDWMKAGDARVSFRYDACGCGVAAAPEIYNAPIVRTAEPIIQVTDAGALVEIPEVNVPEVQVHAGKARIQFEVNRTELHDTPYTCRNGQRIDNRGELQVIDDSVKYALSDPNVELVGIDICGYASPESPYLHNEELADGRSKALAEYLADRYSLPRESVTYSFVPENWGEFREMTVASDEITEAQRQLLLDLIDSPAAAPEDFDRKEKILKTDRRYSRLYRTKILPEWFPKLRATTFALKTQLKDLDDERLIEVFRTSPGKMSLQQLCRVARLYPADSDEFNDIVRTALLRYPADQTAIVNAAIGAMGQGDYGRARTLLKDAEQTPEIFRMLAMMAKAENDYDEAARCYRLAGDSEEADSMTEKADRLNRILNSDN